MNKLSFTFLFVLFSLNVLAQTDVTNYAVESITISIKDSSYVDVIRNYVPCEEAKSIYDQNHKENEQKDRYDHFDDTITNDNIHDVIRVNIKRDRWIGKDKNRDGVYKQGSKENTTDQIDSTGNYDVHRYKKKKWNVHTEKLIFGLNKDMLFRNAFRNDTVEVFKYKFDYPPLANVELKYKKDTFYLYIDAKEFKGNCMTSDSLLKKHVTGHICDPRQGPCGS